MKVVSYSELYKWDTCPRAYYYNFILGLRPEETSDAMSTGIKGHKLLQNFYELRATGKSKEEALAIVHQNARDLMAQEGFADFQLLQAWTLVENYIKETEFKVEAILVENRFLLPASKLTDDPELQEVTIGFTPDVVFRRTGNFMDVEDYKFIQRAWPQKKINMFQQAKLYQIFLMSLGYNVSRSTIRFFNVKTGQCTFKNYTITPIERETLLRDFFGAVKEVLKYRAQEESQFALTRRTSNSGTCQFCEFELPCGAERKGADVTSTLKHLYIKSDYDYKR
jgi:hypothetical protein